MKSSILAQGLRRPVRIIVGGWVGVGEMGNGRERERGWDVERRKSTTARSSSRSPRRGCGTWRRRRKRADTPIVSRRKNSVVSATGGFGLGGSVRDFVSASVVPFSDDDDDCSLFSKLLAGESVPVLPSSPSPSASTKINLVPTPNPPNSTPLVVIFSPNSPGSTLLPSLPLKPSSSSSSPGIKCTCFKFLGTGSVAFGFRRWAFARSLACFSRL